MYDIQLFGRLEVRTRGVSLAGRDFGGVKPRHILALLALRGAIHRTELAELLWDGEPPSGHAELLESYVDLLQVRLDPTGRNRALTCSNDTFGLIGERVRVDVARFIELLSAARGRTATRALPPLIAAAHLAERPLLADERPVWAETARHDLRARLGFALLNAADDALATGALHEARTLAERAMEIDPLTERGRAIADAARSSEMYSASHLLARR